MTFQNHANFSNAFFVFGALTHQKSASDLIHDQDRKAKSVIKDQFRADLNHHLGSDLIRSYVPKAT